jgi:hypothetical protein
LYNTIIDGDSMTENNSIIENDVMKEIIKYNEIDCKMIWEIIKYLRKHNCKLGTYEYDLNVYE